MSLYIGYCLNNKKFYGGSSVMVDDWEKAKFYATDRKAIAAFKAFGRRNSSWFDDESLSKGMRRTSIARYKPLDIVALKIDLTACEVVTK